MPVKIIARPGEQDEVFEIVFQERLNPIIDRILTQALESQKLTISKRCPDGMTTVWECHVPIGELVDLGQIESTQRVLDFIGVAG